MSVLYIDETAENAETLRRQPMNTEIKFRQILIVYILTNLLFLVIARFGGMPEKIGICQPGTIEANSRNVESLRQITKR